MKNKISRIINMETIIKIRLQRWVIG